MGVGLFAALLVALCMALLAPSAAKATGEDPGIEAMEAGSSESAPDFQAETGEEGSADPGGVASRPLADAPEEGQAAPSQDGAPATRMVFADGMAQPVFRYSDARAEGYANADSELWRFCVYVESDYDTDLDGKCDLMKVYVQVPRAAVESGKDGWKAPVLYEARPYNGGMVTDLHGVLGYDSPMLADEALATTPAKRVATSSMTTAQLALDTARSNPEAWNYSIPQAGSGLPENFTFYDYYLVRGYAIVQTAGPGSFGSEGLVCTGTEMERAAFAAVIEWICGKRAAFADKEGTISVSATDWASGDVGMIGHSYSGSAAFEVATTGVDGLKTIIDEAGVASWYGYVNSQGICIEKTKSYDYLNFIAATCTSRLAINDGGDPGFDGALGIVGRYRSFVRDQQVQLKGDFGPFWEAREWSAEGTGINASALIVTGLNDDNVTMRQADCLRDAVLASGQDAKVILHQGNHGLPFDRDDAVDLGMGRHSYAEWVNLWLAHELCGVSNDVDSMPGFLVQSNVDGSFYGSEAWNSGSAVTVRPQGDGEVTVSAKGASYDNESLLQKTLTGKQSENAQL
jgi:X-Pro dipeptidyl-peptidase